MYYRPPPKKKKTPPPFPLPTPTPPHTSRFHSPIMTLKCKKLVEIGRETKGFDIVISDTLITSDEKTSNPKKPTQLFSHQLGAPIHPSFSFSSLLSLCQVLAEKIFTYYFFFPPLTKNLHNLTLNISSILHPSLKKKFRIYLK